MKLQYDITEEFEEDVRQITSEEHKKIGKQINRIAPIRKLADSAGRSYFI